MNQLLFLGDFLYDYEQIQDDISLLGIHFKKNNYRTIVNLEAPLKSHTPKKKWINLFNQKTVIKVLQTLNVIAVNLANNHIMDWEKAGLESIISLLHNADIKYFGAGFDLNQAIAPIFVENNQMIIGMAGFGWTEEMCVPATTKREGVAPINPLYIKNAIEQIKSRNADKIVIHLHWGYEYELYPLPVHRNFAHEIIEMGADLIIGHHAHVIQSFEKYKNSIIYYGLGNFYFGSRRHNFDHCRNPIGEAFSRFGLGVGWNTLTIETILFDSYHNHTQIIDNKNFELIDISNIQMETYNDFFKKNRVSTRKPTLYMSKYSNIIGPIKLYACKIKELIIKCLLISLDKLNLKEFVRTYYYKWKKTDSLIEKRI